MSTVNDAVQDGVRHGGVAQIFVPGGDGEL